MKAGSIEYKNCMKVLLNDLDSLNSWEQAFVQNLNTLPDHYINPRQLEKFVEIYTKYSKKKK